MGISSPEYLAKMQTHHIELVALLQYDLLYYIVLFLVAYVVFVNAVRFQRKRDLHRRYKQYATRESFKNMTSHDAWAIQKEFLQLEFPSMALKSLQFALFRTYGIPSISNLLTKTSQFTCPATALKRYADTTTLIGEFMAFPPSSDRAQTALARTNVLHSGYRSNGSIREEDMLYTLSLFAIEPVRFIKTFEWRPLTDMEMCAIGTYWMSVGEALGISYEQVWVPGATGKEKEGEKTFEDGLVWLQAIEAWSQRYEEKEMKPNQANKVVADQTTELLMYALPSIFRPAALSFVSFMMDDRLRWAMMYDPPSAFATSFFTSLIDIRRFVLRFLTPPRPYFLRYDVFSENPDPVTGRHHVHIYSAAPYYVRPTLWNRWGPGAWLHWAMGLPLPGDQGDKYSPQGYHTPDLGPRYFAGKGLDRMERIKETLRRRC